MSDPGTTYRNREEIAMTRSTRDPLEFVKKTLMDSGFAEADEIKSIEKKIRKEVQAETKKAKEYPDVELSDMFDYVYADKMEGRQQEKQD
eukprot:498288_1